jgi:hypothetical protein
MTRTVCGIALLCFVAGCSSQPAVVIHAHEHQPMFTVELDDGRRAILDPVGDRYSAVVLRVVSIDPAPLGVLKAEDVAFVFTGLEKDKQLLLPNGLRVNHPDRAILAEIDRGLIGTDPDVDALILGRLHELILIRSRGELLAKVASAPMPPPQLKAVIDTVTTPSVVGAPGPTGLVGGHVRDALDVVLPLLAERDDLAAPQALRLLSALHLASDYAARARALGALMDKGHLSTAQALKGTQLLSGDAKAALLTRLAKGKLSRAEARSVLASALKLRSYAPRQRILELLIPEERKLMTVKEIIYAGRSINSDAAAAHLKELAARPSLTLKESRSVLAAALKLRSYAQRNEVASLLMPESRKLMTVSEVINVGRSLGSDVSYAQLKGLAKRSTLTLDESRTVLAVGLKLRSYSQRNTIVEILMPIERKLMTVAEVIAAGHHLGSDVAYAHLIGLAKRPTLTAKEARAVLATSQKLRSYDQRAKVLAILCPAPRELLSIPEVLAAARNLGSDEGHRVHFALAKRPSISASEARLILADALRQTNYSRRATILTSLRPASRKLLTVREVLKAAKSLSSSDRFSTLLSLAQRKALKTSDASLVLAAAPTFSSYSYRKDLIMALIGKVDADKISASAKCLSSDAQTHVLRALLKASKS